MDKCWVEETGRVKVAAVVGVWSFEVGCLGQSDLMSQAASIFGLKLWLYRCSAAANLKNSKEEGQYLEQLKDHFVPLQRH